jgi:hypothetical protein
MTTAKLHNDLYIKKVDDITNLFKWEHSLDKDFPSLPSNAVLINDILVNQYKGQNDEAYMHHATIGKKHGKLYCAHTVHDYDEDAGGKYTALLYSDNGGITWNRLPDVMPQLSDMVAWGVTPAKWSYPSCFINIPSGFYMMVNCAETTSYDPIGTAVRKINPDNTYGEILWVNNGQQGENSRIAPTPASGYPQYNFASESLIEEVRFYINQPKNKPKILFGWSEIWEVSGSFNSEPLREPTVVQPYNYSQWLKVWKANNYYYNVVQNGEDISTKKLSEIPDSQSSTAKRFINYSSEIIIGCGHSGTINRTELMLFIARKNNITGQFEIRNGDVYSLTNISKSAPVLTGKYKEGGEQLPFLLKEGKDVVNVAFSVSKEEIYYKKIDISKLI